MPKNTLREILERVLYLASLLTISISVTCLAMNIEHLLVNFIFHIKLVEFFVFSMISGMGFLLSLELRKVGISRLHFIEHENCLNTSIFQVDAEIGFSTASQDASRKLNDELKVLIDLIEESKGWERQTNRANAKAWLSVNEDKLEIEGKNLVTENLWYL